MTSKRIFFEIWFDLTLLEDDGARAIRRDVALCIISRVGACGAPCSVKSAKIADYQHKGMLNAHENFVLNTLHLYQLISMICELWFPSSILAVKLNRKSLVIVLEMEL